MKQNIKISDTLGNRSELDTLKALQYKIATMIDESKSGRDVAALTRQLLTVNERIRSMDYSEDYSDTVLAKVMRKHQKQDYD